MKGSVTKYSVAGTTRPKWRYRIDAGRDGSGRRIQEGRGGFAKQSEAEAAMKNHIEELKARIVAASRPPAQPAKTLREWLLEWLETYAPDRVGPKSLERYRDLVGYVTAEGPCSEIAQTPLQDLRHAPIEAALYALVKAKGKRRSHLSARTVRHVAGVMNVALNKAFKLELIAVNPMLRVELPQFDVKDAFSLTPEQIQALRAACRGDWTFALIEVALASGARRGELLALRWSDVDWMESTITISKSIEQTRAGLRVKSTKNKKTRPCRLPQSAIAALRFVREQQNEARRLFGADYEDNGLIFCEPSGKLHEPDLISQVVIRRMRKAGVTAGSLHTLRHTHASNLLSKGIPLPAVSARLGHSDTNVTARVYSHALPGDDQRAADAWDAIISSDRAADCADVTSGDMEAPTKPAAELILKGLIGSANGNRTRI